MSKVAKEPAAFPTHCPDWCIEHSVADAGRPSEFVVHSGGPIGSEIGKGESESWTVHVQVLEDANGLDPLGDEQEIQLDFNHGGHLSADDAMALIVMLAKAVGLLEQSQRGAKHPVAQS